MNPTLLKKTRPYIIAHRGAMRLCPENTMAAFIRAVQDGADAVETDVRCSSDGAFVCFHDPSVDRTTGGTGRVEGMSLVALRQLNAAHAREGHTVQPIPTVEELVKQTPRDVGLALELKSPRFDDPSVCAALAGLLRNLDALDRTLVLSFHRRRVHHFVAAAPEVPAALALMLRLAPPRSPGMLGPWWPLLLANPRFVRTAHARGQMVCPLDGNPDARIRRYLRMDVDAILTSDPAATRRLLNMVRGERGYDIPGPGTSARPRGGGRC